MDTKYILKVEAIEPEDAFKIKYKKNIKMHLGL